MKTINKHFIAQEIKKLSQKTSQNIVSQKAGVSSATISQVVNGKWQLIKDDMWRQLQTTLRIDADWKTAETANLKHINAFCSYAQQKSMSVCISHDAGAGKSHGYKIYERNNTNVLYIECKNYWSKKTYVANLLLAAGVTMEATTELMINNFINIVRRMESPLIILDQADKLKDPMLDLFMDLYNDLDGHCGFVLSGVPALKKRILRGVQHDKVGFREIYSRIGRKFISLDPIKLQDVSAICTINGIDDEQFIEDAYSSCDGDFRRVKRSVEQYLLIKEQAA